MLWNDVFYKMRTKSQNTWYVIQMLSNSNEGTGREKIKYRKRKTNFSEEQIENTVLHKFVLKKIMTTQD